MVVLSLYLGGAIVDVAVVGKKSLGRVLLSGRARRMPILPTFTTIGLLILRIPASVMKSITSVLSCIDGNFGSTPCPSYTIQPDACCSSSITPNSEKRYSCCTATSV